VSTPTLTRQCLDLGLLDEVAVSLAPVLLGSGIPFFSGLAQTPVMLDDPEVVVGLRATHLRYRVRR
jgi:dihydrofolate reductase